MHADVVDVDGFLQTFFWACPIIAHPKREQDSEDECILKKSFFQNLIYIYNIVGYVTFTI